MPSRALGSWKNISLPISIGATSPSRKGLARILFGCSPGGSEHSPKQSQGGAAVNSRWMVLGGLQIQGFSSSRRVLQKAASLRTWMPERSRGGRKSQTSRKCSLFWVKRRGGSGGTSRGRGKPFQEVRSVRGFWGYPQHFHNSLEVVRSCLPRA